MSELALTTKRVSGNTTANGQRKAVPNGWNVYSETTGTKACVLGIELIRKCRKLRQN